MPQTVLSAYRNTDNGRKVFGRRNNYRLRPALTCLTNFDGSLGSIDPVSGEAPLTVSLDVAAVTPATLGLPISTTRNPAGGLLVAPAAVDEAYVWQPEGLGTTPLAAVAADSSTAHIYVDGGARQTALVATDLLGRQSVQRITVTAGAATAPLFTVGPAADSIVSDGFTMVAEINEAGTVYVLVLASGDPAPTSATVRDTADGSEAVAADTATAIAISSLASETVFDVYVVAEDDLGNIQAAPTLVEVTTTA